MLSEKTLHKLAAAALDTFDLSNFRLSFRNQAFQEFVLELQDRIELNEDATLLKRFDHFKVSGSVPQDYKERIIQIDEDKFILTGIRHVGGNSEKPFINLWPAYEFKNLADIKFASSVILKAYEVFDPKHISLWVNPANLLSTELSLSVQPSLSYFVGEISKIKESCLPEHLDKVFLKPIQDNSYRKFYEELYAKFHRQSPHLNDWVPMNDADEMMECIEDNLLFEVQIDGFLAGVIGGRNKSLLAESAVYFTEIILAEDFKGKGYAAAVQRRFIDHLPSIYKLVWGTIDTKNFTSTKTALRIGRRSIRSEYFLPVSLLKDS